MNKRGRREIVNETSQGSGNDRIQNGCYLLSFENIFRFNAMNKRPRREIVNETSQGSENVRIQNGCCVLSFEHIYVIRQCIGAPYQLFSATECFPITVCHFFQLAQKRNFKTSFQKKKTGQ